MRRRIRLLAMASTILLSLCACDILFMGRFSSDLGQAVAQADLSAGVNRYDAPSFSLAIVDYEGTEYVLLFSSTGFDSAAAHLYVLSPDLAVLNAYTMDEIAALDPVGVAFSGDAAMTHLAAGKIIIGNAVAMPADGGLALVSKLPATVFLKGWAVEGPSTADYTWTAFQTDPSAETLSYKAYAADLSSVTTISCSLGKRAEFKGAFADPTDAEGSAVLLAFSVENENACRFLQVAKTPDLETGFTGYALLTDYSSVVKYGLKGDTIAATYDGIVAYDQDAHAWIWFSPSDVSTVKSLPVRNWDSGIRKTAFSFSNGWYCVWDADARTLTRYQTWW
jgi:hypothetical protein